jgi:hypothetical protein
MTCVACSLSVMSSMLSVSSMQTIILWFQHAAIHSASATPSGETRVLTSIVANPF